MFLTLTKKMKQISQTDIEGNSSLQKLLLFQLIFFCSYLEDTNGEHLKFVSVIKFYSSFYI